MKQRYRILCILSILLCFVANTFAHVGNNASMKFHTEGCRAERKISASHRVHFDTRDEAIAAGYVPYGICRGY